MVRAGTGLSVLGPSVRRKCQKRESLEHVGPVALRVRVAAGGQVPVANVGHAAGACQMALHRLADALRLLGGVDAENVPGAISFLPRPSLSASRRRMQVSSWRLSYSVR